MHYFVSVNSNQILAGGDCITSLSAEQIAQEWANEIKGDVYVIDGEHSGIRASPKDSGETEGPDAVCLAELKKLEKWSLIALRAKLL